MNFTLPNFNSSKNLAVFDFDYTIINLNSNNYINKQLIKIDEQHDASIRNTTPSIAKINKYKFPEEIEKLSHELNQTIRMQAVFEHINSTYKLGERAIRKCLTEIQISKSMKMLFESLESRNYELCIISDSNTLLIETILQANNLLDTFRDKIFANKAFFDEKECLRVIPVNELLNKDKALYNCESNMCKTNICKGVILQNIINKNSVTNRIIYAGDGRIDFCPGLYLKDQDIFYVKKNLALNRILNQDGMKEKFKAHIKFWKHPEEIFNQLE